MQARMLLNPWMVLNTRMLLNARMRLDTRMLLDAGMLLKTWMRLKTRMLLAKVRYLRRALHSRSMLGVLLLHRIQHRLLMFVNGHFIGSGNITDWRVREMILFIRDGRLGDRTRRRKQTRRWWDHAGNIAWWPGRLCRRRYCGQRSTRRSRRTGHRVAVRACSGGTHLCHRIANNRFRRRVCHITTGRSNHLL